MKSTIDCLIIGHNEMDFETYEKTVRQMGINSGAYRDLNLNFIRYNHKPYTASETFNRFCLEENAPGIPVKPVNMLDTFSATIPYLGTYLHKRGFTFDYIHSFQGEKEELARKLKEENILTIAVTTTLYVSVFPVMEIIDFIKKYNPTAKIIVGGPFISTKFRTQDLQELKILFGNNLKADIYVNSSQGEAALVKIITALKKNLPLSRVNNIYYKTGNRWELTPPLTEDNQLSRDMVDWDLFSHRPDRQVMVRTSISCPFSCAFCGYPEHAGRYQTVDVESIEKELNALEKKKTVKSVYFIDDTFNIPVKRFKEILRMLARKKYSFKWHSYFRCQYADREMVELMKESGCEGVFLGLESGNNQILKNMNKAVTVEKYHEGIALLKEYDMVTYGNFIIGFPGETHETVEDTIKLIEETEIDFYRVQLWYCEVVTPIWQQRDKYNIKGESFEWKHRTMDSKTAADLVEKVFLSIKKSTWMPQYNFNFDMIWHLLHRGLNLEMVKNFLNAFNSGIKEKLTHRSDPSQKEVSYDVIRRLKNYQRQDNGDNFSQKEKNKIDHSEAEFYF